jgi:hypothetical protein
MLLYIAAGKSASRTFRLVVSSFGRCKSLCGKEPDYDADEFDRFPKGAGYPGGNILASLKPQGRPGIVKSAIGMSDGWQS